MQEKSPLHITFYYMRKYNYRCITITITPGLMSVALIVQGVNVIFLLLGGEI